MKKLLFGLLMTVALTSCGGAKDPAWVVEECWQRLAKGDVEGAVELMNAPAEEVALYREVYAEQCGELQAVGGVESFEITGSSEGESDATIDAIVRLKNGQEIEATYRLVKGKKGWLIVE